MNRTQIIIVRHGQTEWNIRGIRQGYLDSPLTDRGLAQAKALGQRLAREKFTALYSSDLGTGGADGARGLKGHGARDRYRRALARASSRDIPRA